MSDVLAVSNVLAVSSVLAVSTALAVSNVLAMSTALTLSNVLASIPVRKSGQVCQLFLVHVYQVC